MRPVADTHIAQRGFTLVELMIALAISGVVMTAIVTTFRIQQASYVVQDDVVVMQQNLRAAMSQMTRELRMARYDPTKIAGATISAATATSITFSQVADTDGVDNNLNGFTDEAGELNTITYSLYVPYVAEGNTVSAIGRVANGLPVQPLAENIQALEFVYLDAGGIPTATLADIATIQVSILARADRADPNFVNTLSYFPASCPQPAPPALPDDTLVPAAWNFDGVIGNNSNAFNDNFRRRLLIATIQLRN